METKLGILDKLRERRHEKAQTALERFRHLAADIWHGGDVSESEAEQVLTAAGKTETDLAAELQRLADMQELRNKLVDSEATRAEIRKRSAAIQKSNADEEAYLRAARDLREKAATEMSVLSAALNASDKARRELQRAGESVG